jgi:hypothetical protein
MMIDKKNQLEHVHTIYNSILNNPEHKNAANRQDILFDLYLYINNTYSSDLTYLFNIVKCNNYGIICFITSISNNISGLKNIKVYGLTGDYHNKDLNDYVFMEVGVKLSCGNTPIEIITIHSGKKKRIGRGSLCIKFLETTIIPKINEVLLSNGHTDKIGYIYGISADLSEDTNALARAKFYSKNGFIITNSHFYKYL